jgi:ubiquitin carboxyl-terminal hydrolase 14
MTDASSAPVVSTVGGTAAATGDGKDKGPAVLGEPEDEIELRKKEAAELSQLIDDDTKSDVGCSATGLYELVGEFLLSDPLHN